MRAFHGRTAVITGAASGFGLEVARRAAAEGMHLVLGDVEAVALARAESELRAAGAEVLAHRVDVSREDSMQAFADAALARFGAPAFVFNNAGVAIGGLAWENTAADWEWVMGVNLMGVVHGVRLFTPSMLAAARADLDYEGHIVNTASIAGLQSIAATGVYCASKHAVLGFTESLYRDLALFTEQVTASVLCPALVRTGISHSERNRTGAGTHALTPSQQLAATLAAQALEQTRLSAADIATMVFAALRERRYYVITHPEALGAVRERMEDILQDRAPVDPMPDATAALAAAMREAYRREG